MIAMVATPDNGVVLCCRITWSRQRFTVSQLALWAMHFANLGYGIVSRDDNPL